MRLHFYVANHKFNPQELKLQQIFIFIISGLPPLQYQLTMKKDFFSISEGM